MNLSAQTIDDPYPQLLACNLSQERAADFAKYFLVWNLDLRPDRACLTDPQGNPDIEFISHGILFVLHSRASEVKGKEAEIQAWCLANAVTAPVINADSITPGLLSTLASSITDNHRQTTSFIRQLARMREVHEELQNSYDELRTFVSDEGLLTPKVGFSNEPTTDQTLPPGVKVVQQLLPTELRRLTGVSLYNPLDAPSDASGSVRIDLFAPSDDRIEYTWRQEVSSFRKGWITFAFDKRKGSFLRRNVALRLIYEGGNHNGPFFAFGVMQVQPNKAAVVDGQPQASALALRTWISLSGAPLTVASQMWPTVRADGSPIERLELTLDGNLEVQDVLRMADRLKFKPIVWDKNRRWIFVHPLSHSPTIARISDACPKGTRRIIAEVETVHEEAATVEYGIAVGSDEDDEIALPEAWSRLPPKVSGEIILELDRPLGRAHSLLLFTRIAENASSDNCWSHFKRVYFEGAF